MTAFVESTLSAQKFEQSVECLSLRFKDNSLEHKYHEKHMKEAMFSKTFKIGLFMLLFDIITRRIILLIFVILNIDAISTFDNCEYLQISLLFAMLILEAICIYVERLNIFKGFFAMVYFFFMTIYTSAIYNHTKPVSVPMHF